MSIGALNISNCTPCGLYMRGVGAQLIGGGDPTNMLDWIAAYDITGIPWGAVQTGNFTAPAQTTPPTQSGGSFAGQLTGAENYLHDTSNEAPPPCTIVASAIPTAYRAQALLPFPTAYYIIAWGVPIDAALNDACGTPAFWVAQGCIYPQQPDDQYPMIVDLPIPDDTLDASIIVQNYYLGIIVPGAGYGNMNGPLFAAQPDLAWGAPGTVCSGGNPAVVCADAHMNGLGPNWNPGANCYATATPSTIDPFTGEDEDP